jgi:hypothetical protein
MSSPLTLGYLDLRNVIPHSPKRQFCAPNLIGSQSTLLDVCPAPSPSCGKTTAWNAPTLGQLTNSSGAGVRRVRDAQKV